MSHIRTLKPEFFKSESLSRLPVPARLTFAGLWCEADDVGRGVANAKVLKGAIWPCDDSVTDKDVDQHLKILNKTGHIALYEVDGKRYFQVSRWDQHQSSAFRRGGTRLPPPPGPTDEPELPLGPKAKRTSTKSTLPPGFTISDSVKRWAKDEGIDGKVDIKHQLELFKDYHVAKGSKFADWNRALQVWLRRSVEYARGSQSGSRGSSVRQSKETVSRGAGRLPQSEVTDGYGEVVVLPGEKTLQNKGIP